MEFAPPETARQHRPEPNRCDKVGPGPEIACGRGRL